MRSLCMCAVTTNEKQPIVVTLGAKSSELCAENLDIVDVAEFGSDKTD